MVVCEAQDLRAIDLTPVFVAENETSSGRSRKKAHRIAATQDEHRHGEGDLNYPIHRFRAIANLTHSEECALLHLGKERVERQRGEVFQKEGDAVDGFHLMLDGWVSSSVILKRGKRLIQKIHLPGDMLSTPSMILLTAADTLTAITPATTSFVSYASLGELFLNAPRLAALFTVVIQMERLTLMDSLAATGNAAALNRLAGLILSFHARLSAIGAVNDDTFELPLTQEVIGDMLGLTSVHVSRMFGSLEDQDLISRQIHRIRLLDMAGLQRLSPQPHRRMKFEPEWLPPSR